MHKEDRPTAEGLAALRDLLYTGIDAETGGPHHQQARENYADAHERASAVTKFRAKHGLY